MQIEKNFTQYVIFAEDSILSALNKITINRSRLIFVVTEAGILQGVMSDGDFRRWVSNTPVVDLTQPVTVAMNSRCCSAPEASKPAELVAMFNEKIQAIPLLDHHGRIVAVAVNGKQSLDLNGRRIGEGSDAFVIAEIGNNHNGSFDLAIQLIDAAAAAGADCAKFQMRQIGRAHV